MVATCAPAARDAATTGPEAGSWSLSRIEHGEAEAIARFYAGFEDETRPVEFWRERLRLWWSGNPAFDEDWYCGVKMISDGKLVGVLAAVPLRILSNGQPVIGAALTTWRVEKDHRVGSIGMFEALLQAHSDRPVFNGTPTQGVIRLLTHYGFEQPRLHFPAARFVCSRTRLLARAFGMPPAAIPGSSFFVNERPASAEEATSLVDDLWTSHRPGVACMGVKDGAWFAWYCRPGRTNGRFGLVVTDAGGRASGVAICMDMGNGVAWVVDMWCDFATPSAIAQVISHARRHATRLGFHCLWVPHFHPAIASACGPRTRIRELPVSAFFKMPPSKEKDPSSYWTAAIGDFGI